MRCLKSNIKKLVQIAVNFFCAAFPSFLKIYCLANRFRLAHLGGAELPRKSTGQKVDPPLEF